MSPNKFPLRHSFLPQQNYPRQNFNKSPKRKIIDKCKIGNHNCDPQTQICRRTDNDFICINIEEIENYDRLHPYVDDYLTTMSPNYFDNRKLRTADIICSSGFELNKETNECLDINECETGTHNCTIDYRCDNKIGM
jgi:fibulin 1/2